MKDIARRGIAVILLLTITTGCGNFYPQAHMQELKDRVLATYTTSTPDRLYYIGSDKSDDYFYLQNEDKRYRVSQTESTQFPKMNLTEDRAIWVVVSPAAALDGGVLETKIK